MIKNYFRIALRNLLKFRSLAFINIVGLAVGIASCIVILLYVANELGYDKFNNNADQIYRIHLEAVVNGGKINVAMIARPLGPTLARLYPEVISYTRIKTIDAPMVKYKNNAFTEKRFYWVDSTFFDVFTVPFVQGDPKTALTRPNSIVVTESVAKKYFGNENRDWKNCDEHPDGPGVSRHWGGHRFSAKFAFSFRPPRFAFILRR